MRAAQQPRCAAARRRCVAVAAAYRPGGSAGLHVLPASIKVGRQCGEGSFGQVFEGTWETPSGGERVILKRVKARVEGAEAMQGMELLLNAYAAKVAKEHCADFLGYCEVDPTEATARLTPGLWLMWRFEGNHTLAYYLRRRDTLRALAVDMEIPENAVVATVMKQVFEGLAAFHAAGLVHRDIKPLNMIFATDLLRFKLIDLGACADLRNGTNWVPDESILDPNYCPPEQYVLPTDSPNLSKSFLKLAISPVLWAQHKPDRFDMWSAGVVMLQLAVPAMRQDRVLRRFNAEYGPKYDYDLEAWRDGSFIPSRDFAALDADDGAGWDLVSSLLRPRSIKVLDDNTVAFVNDASLPRLSAAEALRHRFMKQAVEPGILGEEEEEGEDAVWGRAASTAGLFGFMGGTGGGSTSSGSGSGSGGRRVGSSGSGGKARTGGTGGSAGQKVRRSGGSSGSDARVPVAARSGTTGGAAGKGALSGAAGLWRSLTSKLFDLEANIMVTASATEKQSTVVKKLQAKASQGKASREALAAEQRKLGNMQQQLSTMQDDYSNTARAVNNVLAMLGFGNSSRSGGQKAGAPSSADMPAPAGRQAVDPLPARSGGLFGRAFGGTTDAAPISATPPTVGAGGGGGAGGLWTELQRRMGFLEDKLANQAIQTERQVFTVRKLRVGVKTGEVDDATLRKAEAILERMERRVSELDSEVRRTRQEATGLLGMLAASVRNLSNAASGAISSSSSTDELLAEPEPSSAALPVEAANRPPSPPPALPPQQQQQQPGGGGFFNRVFRRGGAGSPPPEAPAPPPPASVAPAASAPPAPSPSAQPAAFGGNSSASNLLRFTSMMGQAAMGMAASIKADAEKVLRDLEAEAEAKRARKAAEQAFLRMLGSKDPPMEPGSSFAEVEAAFGEDPRYLAVDPAQRPLLVATFVDALVQAQLRTQEQAKARLRDAISLRIKPGTTWEALQEQMAQDPTFLAVDEVARRPLFEEVVTALRIADENRLAAGLAEVAYMEMLAELQPPIAADTPWPRARPLMWRDYRYLALPEGRRRALYDDYVAGLPPPAPAPPPPQVPPPAVVPTAAPVPAAPAVADGEGAAVNSGLLAQLRAEQARLRAEYDRMERTLRDMEAALAAKEEATAAPAAAPGVTPPSPATPPPPSPTVSQAALASSLQSAGVAYRRTEDGTLVFEFDDDEEAEAAVGQAAVTSKAGSSSAASNNGVV